MRDTLKDEPYWTRMIERRSTFAQECVTSVDAVTLPSRQHLASARAAAEDLLRLISCRYSAGMNGFRESLINAVRMMEIGWDGSYLPTDHRKNLHHEYWMGNYDSVLWCLSLAHLLEGPDELFLTLGKIVDRDGIKDLVLEFLLKSRLHSRPQIESEIHAYVKLDKAYTRLRQAITEPDLTVASEALKGYVRQDWYRNHGSAGWYNSHKSEAEIYTGYWCWEATAVVKLRGLDDSGFRDWKYYPKDMLTGLK